MVERRHVTPSLQGMLIFVHGARYIDGQYQFEIYGRLRSRGRIYSGEPEEKDIGQDGQ